MRISGLLSVRHAPVDFTVYHSGLGKYTTDYSNLPQRYIKRMITRLEWKSPNHPRYAPRCRSFVPKYHSLERPWTQGYMAKHGPGGRSVVRDNTVVVPCVEPIKEADWMWFRGDRVEILTGPDKGKQGYIDSIVQERNWCTVEGLNCDYELMGGTKDFPGMMMKKEQPLIVNKDIRLVDPSSEEGGEVEWRWQETGERVRVAVRSGTVIPIPSKASETIDYKDAKLYKANEYKDTVPRDVTNITYEPNLATFEMDVMQAMGIKETRIPKKSWWY